MKRIFVMTVLAAIVAVATTTSWSQPQRNGRGLFGGALQLLPSDDEALIDDVDNPVVDPVNNSVAEPQEPAPKHWVGIDCEPASPVLLAHLEVPEGGGLVITRVVPESPADKAGLVQYDIILEVNRKPIGTNDAMSELIRETDGRKLRVELLRAGKWQALELTPELIPEPQSDDLIQIQVGNKLLTFPPDVDFKTVTDRITEETQRQNLNPAEVQASIQAQMLANARQQAANQPQGVLQQSDMPPNFVQEYQLSNGGTLRIERVGQRPPVIRYTVGDQTYVTTDVNLLPEEVRPAVRQLLAQSPNADPAHDHRHGEPVQQGRDQSGEIDWARFGIGIASELIRSGDRQPDVQRDGHGPQGQPPSNLRNNDVPRRNPYQQDDRTNDLLRGIFDQMRERDQ